MSAIFVYMIDGSKNLKNLVEKAKKGDKDAFGDLYNLHYGPIYGYIARKVSPPETAEDIAEEVFIKAWLSIGGLTKNDKFVAWLYMIARNQITDFYRKNAKYSQDVNIDDFVNIKALGPSPEETTGNSETRESVSRALEKLSADYRSVLELKFLQDLSTEDTAKILGKSVGNIRIMQLRALKKLKSILEEEHYEDL